MFCYTKATLVPFLLTGMPSSRKKGKNLNLSLTTLLSKEYVSFFRYIFS